MICGSVVIAGGSTLAGLFAFQGRLLIVMGGFLIFIAGYRVSQVDLHTGGDILSHPSVFNQRVGRQQVTRGILLTVGWIGIAFGVTMFSQTILDPSLTNAVLSGVSSIGGYMSAHVGINGVGLGDSVFGSLLDQPTSQSGRDH